MVAGGSSREVSTFVFRWHCLHFDVWPYCSPNRKNWAAAQLIFMAIGTVLYFALMAIFGAALLGLAGNMGS